FTEKVLREAYHRHLTEIRAIARTHIENGWIDEKRRVFLTTRFTRMKVSFDDSLDGVPGSREIAESAQRILAELIGPNAGEIEVRWGATPGAPDNSVVSVQLIEPDLGYSLAASFGVQRAFDPDMLSMHLARAWGSVLRERSRKLTLQSG